MSDFLAPSKITIVDHLKSLPDAGMAELLDFETWGWQFVELVVSFELVFNAQTINCQLQGEYNDLAGVLDIKENDKDVLHAVVDAQDTFRGLMDRAWLEWAGALLMPAVAREVEDECKAAEAERQQVEAEEVKQVADERNRREAEECAEARHVAEERRAEER